jgi:hypothetical protein
MKSLIPLVSLFILIGCENSVSLENIDQLNGYWEIVEVEFNDGQVKKYTVNPSIDYIEVKGMRGFKKKVHPKFDGSYDTSNDAENFTLLKKEDNIIFFYENSLAQWEEQLVKLEKNAFSITNQDNITYTYKRYEPINIE